MRFLRKLAFAAGAMCAPSMAMAQYYPYGAPATLPAPAQQVRPLAYAAEPTAPTPAPAQEDYSSNSNGYKGALSNESGSCSSCNGGTGCGASACDSGCDSGCGGGCDSGCGGGWLSGLGLGGGCGGGCGDDACCCGPSWYASVAGLYMERTRPNPFQVSFDTTDPTGELILNIDSMGDWEAGFEVRAGRYIGCNSAIELGYWTLGNFEGEAYALDPPGVGSLNTPFDFRSLNFAGTPVNDLFDGSQAHRLRRDNEIHNLELNFVNWPMVCDPCSRLQVSWLAGLRFFTFREGWELGTSFGSPDFGVDPANEAYWSIDVDNDMYGLQVGGCASYCLNCKLSAYAAPRFGAFWNHMEQTSTIYLADPLTYALNETSDRDAISLMGQLEVGLNYQLTPCIGVWGGYRVVAFSGVALADEQIPFLADDIFGINDIDHNANLVLHGLMGGVTVNF